MTREITLEFGRLVAYLIPGVIACTGMASWFPAMGALLFGSTGVGGFTVLLIMGLVVGMIISVVRGGTIDHSFLINFRMGPLKKLGPKWGRIERVDPDYAVLVTNSALDAFESAKADDKRPYQFYGNTLIALIIYIGARVAVGKPAIAMAVQAAPQWLSGCVWMVTALAFASLYVGARTSHCRFMNAVRRLNGLGGPPPYGRPVT